MAVKSKTQLATDISTNVGASYNQSNLQTVLSDIVDSYEDLLPQLTTVQRDALTPTNGQIVYNTDTDRYEYWNGVVWYGVGQDLSTPLVVKIDLSSADILAIDTTPIQVASSAGVGYALMPISLAYRYTFGSVAYAGGNIILKCSSKSTANGFTSISGLVLQATANRSGSQPANTGTGIDAIIDNDTLELKATAPITTGDGTLTVWVTYSIINY